MSWGDDPEFVWDMHSCPLLGQMGLTNLSPQEGACELMLEAQRSWQLSHMCYAQPMPHMLTEFSLMHAMTLSLMGSANCTGQTCAVDSILEASGKRATCTKAKSRKQRRQRLKLALEEEAAAAACIEPLQPAARLLEQIRCIGCEHVMRTQFQEASLAQRTQFFAQVLADAPSLASDPDAHSILLHLFQLTDPHQKALLVQVLISHFSVLSKDQWGCRVLQLVLEQATRAEQAELANCLRHRVVKSSEHAHANFVVQKCIEQMQPEDVAFISDEIKGRVFRLSQHEYGCRVIQRLLEFWCCNELDGTVDEILQCLPALCESKYGNHVVQQVLQHGSLEDQQKILQVIEEDIANYSKMKYSSRVVEKCLEIVQLPEHALNLRTERHNLTSKILGEGPHKHPLFLELACHPYGNYVVQQAIKCCDDVLKLKDLLAASETEHSVIANHHVVATIHDQLARNARLGSTLMHHGS